MLEIKFVSVLLLSPFVLIGCQNNNNNLNLTEDVTRIEVYAWDSDEFVATINDKEFIDGLVKKLDKANTSSTANMNFQMPDYKLLLRNNAEVKYEIGYYKKVRDLGIKGQYWEFDKIYGVKLKLPID
ncbi:hypothetical protein ACFO3D_14175 [Virgibacillus kekensis]|uniref:DUF4830 domain-containing protein n=1 Tax=Virgibacillus kekensis TaxID=202261 RepID=A0ABV9DMM5_9BACI